MQSPKGLLVRCFTVLSLTINQAAELGLLSPHKNQASEMATTSIPRKRLRTTINAPAQTDNTLPAKKTHQISC